jgi:hypothetical protein
VVEDNSTPPAPSHLSVAPPGYVSSAPRPETNARPPETPATSQGRAARLVAGGVGLVALVALAFVLFASTGSRGTGALAQAATLSSATPGYRMHMTFRMNLPTVSTPITATGDAVVDQRDHAASMSFAFDLSQVPQASEELGSNTMQMSAIMDRSAFYIRFPQAVFAQALGGKQWLKVDFAKLTGTKDLWSLGNNPTMGDPSQMLQYLRGASNSVTSEGQERVDGVIATHYKAEVSLDRVSPTAPAADQPALRQMTAKLEEATHTHQLPMDVWIDAHHLVRRMLMTLQLPVQGEVMAETMTADLTDYGPQPRPAVPPADQVRDLSGLASTGG